MKMLRMMDSTGDTVINFDEAKAKADATKEVRALFERMSKAGAAVFSIDKDGGNTRVKDFKDLAEDNVIVPRIVSG